jgi:hypothetical protein
MRKKNPEKSIETGEYGQAGIVKTAGRKEALSG